MAYSIEELDAYRVVIEGVWRFKKPSKSSFWWRIKDAWLVLKGKCVAVGFYKQ